MLVLYVKHRLTRMPIGRAWEALREDEVAKWLPNRSSNFVD
jgi:branched-chain amino acid transport system permease protein